MAGQYIHQSYHGELTAKNLSGLHAANSKSMHEDITTHGCFSGTTDREACTRYIIMTVVILITLALCVYKILRLHLVKHQAKHHYLIFYFSATQCILCAVHWTLGKYAQLDFIAQWFKQLSYLVVTHLFWSGAHRAIRREALSNYCLIPSLVVAFIGCTVVTVLAVLAVTTTEHKNVCLVIFWLVMSCYDVFIVQMFLVAAVFISRRLAQISTISQERRRQKLKLWGLVLMFEFSALVGASYDVAMRVNGSEDEGCGAIFNQDQGLYSGLFGTFMIIKFAAPVWVMLAVLEPIAPQSSDSDDEDDSQYLSSNSLSSERQFPVRRNFNRPRVFRPSRSHEGLLASASSGQLTTVSEESMISTDSTETGKPSITIQNNE